MSGLSFSTAHLDYLQRNDFIINELPASASMTDAPPPLRRLWHIRGIGRIHKSPFPNGRTGPAFEMFSDQPGRLNSEDILVGLYGYKIPLAFLVLGSPGGVTVCLGTWSPTGNGNVSDAISNEQQAILKTVLKGLYPAIDLDPADTQLLRPPAAGFALGIPTAKPPDPFDGALPLDRLIRAMAGTTWAGLVLAQPVGEGMTNSLRHCFINEIRAVSAAEQAELAPSPLAEHYKELLKVALTDMTHGQAVGAWRTAVYLLGEATSYYRLASVWRGIFSGDRSLPEPVRVWDYDQVAEWAAGWVVPDTPGQRGPGHYQHPFQYQTLLTSSQLAAYVHLPQLETSGFAVSVVPDFDVVPPPVKGDNSVSLGQVIDRTRPTETSYLVSAEALNRHALVVGVTGSGKTNTCFHLLKQLWQLGIPFLVIEPAKTEYRSLLADPLIGRDLRVFTLGNEQMSPFRLNPFGFETGVSLSSHIDLLKSVFNAAFSMWTVLPQVLEQSLHEVYREYGWDVVRNENRRLPSSSLYRAEAFPTLTDLQQTVRKVVARLGYEPKTTSEIKAALVTRLQSLRIGGKGKMLDTRQSFPMGKLLEKPTILELEEIGDDDEKAFIIGLVLVRLYEHLRGRGLRGDNTLKHVVVVEEAHRLLSNVPMHAAVDVANTRGKAVETFVNMLSEVRAYGEGFLVAEQIPSKLSPDVIKNTNVKIVHRTVAGDDRNLMGQAMNMQERQSGLLGTLTLGEAVVFAESDDRPIMVGLRKFEKAARGSQSRSIDTVQLMAKNVRQQFPEVSLDCLAGCQKYSAAMSPYCDLAQEVAETTELQNAMSFYILSIVATPESITGVLPAVLEQAQRHHPGLIESPGFVQSLLIHSVVHYLRRMGHNYQWPFDGVASLRDALAPTVLEALQSTRSSEGHGKHRYNQQRLSEFREAYERLCTRNFDPFPACKAVCDQRPSPLCLYRYHIETLLENKRLHTDFVAAIQTAESPKDMLEKLRDVSLSASSLCVTKSAPQKDQRRIALCYAIQKLAGMSEMRPALQAKLADRLVDFLKGVKDNGGL